MAVDISKVEFGSLAAERDITQGLDQYFLESGSYERFRDGSKTVALGNRGSGKTAIFKMLAKHERSKGSCVIELSPDEYSYELLSRTMLPEERGVWAKQGAYSAAWKYLLYVLAMKEIMGKGSGHRKGAEAKIFAYLRDNHKNMEKSPLGTLISYLKRLESVKIGPYEAGLKVRELHNLYKLEDINVLLPALHEICEHKRVIIMVDELDKGWDASEDAKCFVAGLFQAAVSINEKSPHIRVLISLRRELYENIPSLYEDAQKYRDIIEHIEWDEPDLLSVVSNRIAHSLPEYRHLSSQELWNLVFSDTLQYRQTKSFNYMIDRTLYRPRELLQFAITSREIALKHQIAPPLDYPTISEAEFDYSRQRSQDIAREYRFQYPGLDSIFETFRGRAYTFDRDQLEYHCLSITSGDLTVADDAKWVFGTDYDYLVDVLWRVGFFRAQAVGGLKARARSGSKYLGSHQIDSLNLRNIPRFHVHPMFRTFLGLKESREQGVDE